MVDSKEQKMKKVSSATGANRKPARLGRGLRALMAQPVKVEPSRDSGGSSEDQVTGSRTPSFPESQSGPTEQVSAVGQVLGVKGQQSELTYLPVDAVTPNPHQPREVFSEDLLARLAESVRTDGLMQPIIVRPHGGGYELVAGERRWRAAQMADLKVLPAIVRSLDDQQMAEWALIENLQREDLNAMERAKAFQNLIEQFHLSHDQVAQRVGVERSTVSNSLRLLDLCAFIQGLVGRRQLSAGHAKALAGITDLVRQEEVARRVITGGWSVRQVEQEVRRLTALDDSTATAGLIKKTTPKAYIDDLEQQLGQALQTKVKIRPGRKKGSGTLRIDFYNLDQFDSLMQRLNIKVQMD